VACLGKDAGKWYIAVDGSRWDAACDMAWQPVFSPDNRHVAAKTEQDGKYCILMDGRIHNETYEALWDPVFSSDGEKILIRGVKDGGKYYRHVLPVTEI